MVVRDTLQLMRATTEEAIRLLLLTLTVLPGFAADLRSGSPELLSAIRANNESQVKALTGAGADPNSTDSNGASALMYAALHADTGVVAHLLSRGAKPNHADSDGATPLHWATHDPAKMRLLLKAGAKIDAKSKIDMTPILVAAAWPDNDAVVKLLLRGGADPKAAGGGNENTLTRASYTGDAESVHLLLKAGADPNLKGFRGRTALQNAVQRGDRRMVDVLLQAGADVKTLDCRNETVLHRYGFWNDPQLVRLLMERGVDPVAKDTLGRDALLFAAASDTVAPEVVKLLLQSGLSVGAKNAYGDTALDSALRSGNAPLVRLLGGKVPPAAEAVHVRAVDPSFATIRNAVAKSIDLLGRTSASVLTKGRCTSCHHQSLPSLAAAEARRLGVDTTALTEVNRNGVAKVLQRTRALLLQGVGPAGEGKAAAWALIGLKADGYQPDLATDAAVAYVAQTQLRDGSWAERYGRPPLEYSPVTATAVSVRALRDYELPGRRAEFQDRMRRAVRWLEEARPTATEEKAMRLLGMVWGDGDASRIRSAATDLLREQRPDGGWAQLPSLPSDAYATGQALVALHAARHIDANSAAFERGTRFLLGTQQEDGSWLVRGRSLPVQSYFESGFPHGRDQWISAAGTSWATMALSVFASDGTTLRSAR